MAIPVYKPQDRGTSRGAKQAMDIELSKITWSSSHAVVLLAYNNRQYHVIPSLDPSNGYVITFLKHNYHFITDHSISRHHRPHVASTTDTGHEIGDSLVHLSASAQNFLPKSESCWRTKHLQIRAGAALFTMVWITSLCQSVTLPSYKANGIETKIQLLERIY